MITQDDQNLVSDLTAIVAAQAQFIAEKGLNEEFAEWCRQRPGAEQREVVTR